MRYRRMTISIPESMRGEIIGLRVPTPIADELERRLAEPVARLEETTANGRHPVAAALALAIGMIRKAEVDLSGGDLNVPPSQIERAKEIVTWARRQLDRVDVVDALAEFARMRQG